MTPTPDPIADARALLRLRGLLVAHLIAELEALDPRTLDGAEHLGAARRTIATRLDTLRAERDAVAFVLGALDQS